MLLSETKISKAKPREKQYKLQDGQGLYILIHPNGSKYWRFRYTLAGKESVAAIGKYPVITLAEARNKRLEYQRLVAAGKSPTSKISGNSFEEIARDWHIRNKSKWQPKNVNVVLARLETYIFPKFGRKPISEVKPMEILEAIQEIEDKGYLIAARRALQTITAIFGYAVLTEKASSNVAYGLSKALQTHTKKNHPHLKLEELPDFLKAVDSYPIQYEIHRLALKFQLLTFLRSSEARKSKWSYIKGNQLIVPAYLMKMRDEHIVPLSSQTLKLLESIRKLTGENEYIFSIEGYKKPYINENAVNNFIAKIKYKGRVVNHGFRTTASTTLHENVPVHGCSTDAIEKQLSHEDSRAVRAVYNKAEYLPERIKLMQWWADELVKHGLTV